MVYTQKRCTSNLLETLDFISDAEEMTLDEIWLDLAMAFDFVPHIKLLHNNVAMVISKK